MKYEIYGQMSLPNMPWAERPEGERGPVWRSKLNPIITRDAVPTANSIYNSAVVPFNGKFAGVFRVDDTTKKLTLHRGFSDDGVNWNIDHTPISPIDKDGNRVEIDGYDPRVIEIDNTYYVCYCNQINGPTIGILRTTDFETFYEIGNAFPPFNRNGVLLPRKVNGNYVMLSRPSDNGHTAFGDIYYSESPDLEFWGRHKVVMTTCGGWQSLKIGPGPVPIETSEGWLMIYHGVLLSCNGYVYSAGVAILDRDDPSKVKYRAKSYILAPREIYEYVGDVPNVVFPVATLCDADTGHLTIYYGAADTVVGMAHTTVDELIDFAKANS